MCCESCQHLVGTLCRRSGSTVAHDYAQYLQGAKEKPSELHLTTWRQSSGKAFNDLKLAAIEAHYSK